MRTVFHRSMCVFLFSFSLLAPFLPLTPPFWGRKKKKKGFMPVISVIPSIPWPLYFLILFYFTSLG
ncbi:hypothetical protein QBC35DRAFT_495753 [Podospora australis]|uniref:Uncharacterized protein n=1 Tax=Podospora australis TaxID=1536484 RepID=A0AAN7AIP3_9PEZI|nr:hypothetical protein QBC35DRAFT_495753 [Podospora australis]